MKERERNIAFPGSILENEEKLLFLYREASDKEKFAISNVWNNVKFFTTISSALLTASIAVFKVIRNPPALGGSDVQSLFLLVVLPIMVVLISLIGIKNLEREYSRFLECIAVIEKLREKLGLYEEVAFRKFPRDRYFIPERFFETPFYSSEEFIRHGLTQKGTLFFYFKVLHFTYVLLSFIIILTVFLL